MVPPSERPIPLGDRAFPNTLIRCSEVWASLIISSTSAVDPGRRTCFAITECVPLQLNTYGYWKGKETPPTKNTSPDNQGNNDNPKKANRCGTGSEKQRKKKPP